MISPPAKIAPTLVQVVLGLALGYGIGCWHCGPWHCGPAQALLISLDDPVHGPGTITLDTETGLEWLDLSLSQNRSFRDIVDQLETGGEFAGFRHATSHELLDLLNHASIPDVDILGGTIANTSPTTTLLNLLGPTHFQEMNPEAFGFLGDEVMPGVRLNGDLDFLLFGGESAYWVRGATGIQRHETSQSDQVGHWLVRETPQPTAVPESLPFISFALFLGCGVWFSRRHQRCQ
jgi:hypothetical protein